MPQSVRTWPVAANMIAILPAISSLVLLTLGACEAHPKNTASTSGSRTEIVSPHTRDNDVVAKLAEYHRAGVPLYVIIDQETEGGPRRLLGYRLHEVLVRGEQVQD